MSRRFREMFPSILRLPGAFSDPSFLPCGDRAKGFPTCGVKKPFRGEDAVATLCGPRPLFPVRDVDLPRLPTLGRPDDPLPLHLLADAGRAVETDLEAPLEQRERTASRAGHEFDRLVELLVPRSVPLLRSEERRAGKES